MSYDKNFIRNLILAAAACLSVHLFVTRSPLVFIPTFAAVLFALWKRGGGSLNTWGEDDPSDWWKKDRSRG
ncbi:MAG: hypothetical protein FGM27_03120 [Candidatus Omnitrophica bacterium]|nr:hypothetical protein [Candidatus Omnitrophota bacterium]